MKKVLLVLCCIFLIGISVGCTQEDAEDVWTHNVYPSANNTYDVGSPSLQYQDGYFVNIYTTGNTTINGTYTATTGNFTNINVLSGGQVRAWDAANVHSVWLRHDGTNGVLQTDFSCLYFYSPSNIVGHLGDSVGLDEFQIEDSGNARVAAIDSDGNIDAIGNISGKNLSISNVATIGNVNTKALLTLASGNVTAGLAPLVFTAGPLLTVPVAGAMEFDGTGIYLTPTNHRRFISLASDSMIATTNTAALTSTVLWNGTINANELKVNRVYNIRGAGLYTTHDANDQVTINVTADSTNIISMTTPKALVTNASWSFEVFFTVRSIVVNGTISSHGDADVEGTDICLTRESVTIDTTVVNYVIVTAKWSDTSNEIKLTQCWLATAD